MNNKISALHSIINDIYTATTLEAAMDKLEVHLKSAECPIRDSEKRIILIKARGCTKLLGLQTYMTNSFLKFENLGVSRF